MSVFKRKTSRGETEEYHYRFQSLGKLYYGVCYDCFSKEEAFKYEAMMRKKVSELASQKSVKALVENFRAELIGEKDVSIDNGWKCFLEKPSARKRTDKYIGSTLSRWNEFVAWLKENHPDISKMQQVTHPIAEEYIVKLRSGGLSPSTMNTRQKILSEVFSRVCGNTAESNPFQGIPLLRNEEVGREAFSVEELEKILKLAPPFIRDIFIVGFFTALREGDICTLRWSDVIWDQSIIRRKLLKTGAIVEIPIMPPLANFIKGQIGKSSEYILPEQAKMYLENQTGISYRVKKFLEDDLGIQTTKKVPGRKRAVSVKDVHSLRHTFCFFAGVAGIPLVVVQSIVGHMNQEMTAHYTAHADRRTKREKMASLPFFNAMIAETKRSELVIQKRKQLIEAIKKADANTLERIGAILLPVKPKRSLPHNIELGTPKR